MKVNTGFSREYLSVKKTKLLQRTRQLLRFNKFYPKKRLGQNFVVDITLLEKIVSYAEISKDDVVLEVGAGLGFLTELLSSECKKVIAVEIDPKLIKILRKQLHCLQNVDLIEGNILDLSVSPFNKVVSTPPYSISSPLLFWLLKKKFECAVLAFQKEFAERLAASVGSRDYGRLTVTTYCLGEIELLDYVSRKSFYPPPDVDSRIVRLRPKEPPFRIDEEETFLELVQTLFTQRNKKVRNAIAPFLKKHGKEGENLVKLAESLPFHDKRVRTLAPEDFGTLANEIVRMKDSLT